MHKNKQPAVTIQPSPSLVSTLLFLLTFLFILSIGPDVFAGYGGEHKGHGFHKQMFNCTLTSKAALQACKNEAADDLWIAIGNCNNLSDAEERPECLKDARATQLEDLQTCGEQYHARQEICSDLGEAPYAPDLSPADFLKPHQIKGDMVNRYFPLVKGTQWIYKGETEEGTEVITVTVTGKTKEIEYPEDSGQLFKCREVRDTVTLVKDDEGESVEELVEDTKDWYAQDKDGNVWYFGEIALNYEDGEIVDVEGSWKAGVDGAKPGIVMLAAPQEGDIYRQEFLLGDAEDMALVLSTDAGSVTVTAGTYDENVLQTEEWTPIEPDVVEYKYYAPGIGMVLEENPDTGEWVELIEVTIP